MFDQDNPLEIPSISERMNVLTISLNPSRRLTSGCIIIFSNVIEAMIQTGSDIIDSMVSITLVLPRLGTVLSRLLMIPKTATVLVPPTMAPRSIP